MMSKPRLPVRQLAVLSISRFPEPLAQTSVNPYLPEMIESFGVPKNAIAKWAGLTAAVFSLAQSVTAIPWGIASDKVGRKTILLIGLLNTMWSSLFWGFSTNLPTALIARALAGAGTGNVGIVRTIVAELCPWKELQPRAFVFMPMVFSIGATIGPAIGGALSNPLHVDPQGSKGDSLFERFPYLLPNVVAAAFLAFGIVAGTLFLRETLETRKDKNHRGKGLTRKVSHWFWRKTKMRRDSGGSVEVHETDPLIASDSVAAYGAGHRPSIGTKVHESHRRPTLREVITWQTSLNLVVYALLALHSLGFDQLTPVFMHHPPQEVGYPATSLPFRFGGGFGIGAGRIGTLLSMYGIVGLLSHLFIFPAVARRAGVYRCMLICSCAQCVVYFLTPFTSLLPSTEWQEFGMIIVLICKSLCGSFAFPCNMIMLTNSASSTRVLGTLNGIAASLAGLGRAAGPFLGGLLFTWGAEHNFIVAPFWALSATATLNLIPLCILGYLQAPADQSENETSADPLDTPTKLANDEEEAAIAASTTVLEHSDTPPDSRRSSKSIQPHTA